VAGLAEEFHRELAHAEGQLHHLRPVAGMDQHGGVRPGEDPRLHQGDLAAPLLLCRTPDQKHRARHAIQHGPHGQSRPQRGRPDQIVAAGVSQAGQGVVLGQERDARRARPGETGERRGLVRHTALHREAVLLQNIREEFRRLTLLVCQLRVRVQEPADRDKVRGQPVHLGLNLILELLHLFLTRHAASPLGAVTK
jgi:hypothetical protein